MPPWRAYAQHAKAFLAVFPLVSGYRNAGPNPLRVALLSGNYDCVRDGANRALNRLVAFLLTQAGAKIRIYSPVAPQKAFASVGDIVPVRSTCIPRRPEYRLALGLSRATCEDLEAFVPDIINLSAPDILGWQAQNYARAAGIPVVASLHTRLETNLHYWRIRRKIISRRSASIPAASMSSAMARNVRPRWDRRRRPMRRTAGL